MKFSTLLVVAVVGFIGILSSARAADLAPIYKAAPVAVAPWTGFYVGAHAGFGFGNKKFFDNFPTPDGELDADSNINGWIGGLQAGYNYQFNRLLLGAEGEFTWGGIDNTFGCFSFGDQVCSARAEWIASLTGRIGAVFGPTLLYVKGGPAWVHDAITDRATCAGTQPVFRAGISAVCGSTFFGHDTRLGWTVGGGIEYLFLPNWSLRIEYDHMDFGRRSMDLNDAEGNFFTEEVKQHVDLIKAGINYKFDWDSLAADPAAVSFPVKAPVRRNGEPEEAGGRVLLFGGADVGKNSVDGWAGTFIALSRDLDTSGGRVMISGGAGRYKYPTDSGDITGVYSTGEILAGYGFEGDNYSVNLLAGPNAINHMLSAVDLTNPVQGTAVGVKVRGDAWVNPTPLTLTYAEGEYSTAFQTFYLSGKLGYDITGGKQIFVGPESSFFGDERSDQWRVGAHVTQVMLGRVQADISAGFAHDSVTGDGAYTHLELSTKF